MARRSRKKISWLVVLALGVAAYFFRGQLKSLYDKYVTKKIVP